MPKRRELRSTNACQSSETLQVDPLWGNAQLLCIQHVPKARGVTALAFSSISLPPLYLPSLFHLPPVTCFLQEETLQILTFGGMTKKSKLTIFVQFSLINQGSLEESF